MFSALAEEWVQSLPVSEDDGLEHLVRRYLGGFGPAARQDIASWAGVPVTFFKPVLDRIELLRFHVLSERYRPRIFNTKAPQSFATFLVDGAVAGTWRYEDGRVLLEPFERLPRAVRRELDDEAERLAASHA